MALVLPSVKPGLINQTCECTKQTRVMGVKMESVDTASLASSDNDLACHYLLFLIIF
jgi:hypothetical protein